MTSFWDRWPKAMFVVVGVMGEAAVQDAHEPIAQDTMGLVVGVTGGSVGVIERPGAW